MKDYILEIPRNHYDRLGDAFEWDDAWFMSFDPKKDTVKFRITEEQRKKYSKYARKKDDKTLMKKLQATYWITQIFLPKNIGKYTVGV